MRQIKILLGLAASVSLTACATGTQSDWYSTNCQADIDSGRELGIKAIPDDLKKYRKLYCKYTEVIAPNGKPIRIFAQNDLSNEQVLYARSLLEFYLEDSPGTEYGADKAAIANNIADGGAILSMLNGSDGQYELPNSAWDIVGQPLYDNETPAIGSPAYINNDYGRRDAGFEEIFHFVHDAGIGVDFPGAPKGAAPEYQQQIRAAATNALPSNKNLWARLDEMKPWLEEISQEGSITQEYIASVIDSYYGLWAAFTERPGGMWGGYIAKTREEVAEKDPMGYALMEMFLKPYLTFEARIAPSFEGTFVAHFDPENLYTHKSQYLVNLTLTGANDSSIVANDQDNQLKGNAGNNTLDGGDGTDTVVVEGDYSSYDVSKTADGLVIKSKSGNGGVDTLKNIEIVRFADRQLDVAGI